LASFFLPKINEYRRSLEKANKIASSIPVTDIEFSISKHWFESRCVGLHSIFSEYYQGDWSLEVIRIFVAISAQDLSLYPLPSSYYWHRDSDGHSIKIWLPIASDGADPPYTSFINGSHVQPPIPQNWEMYRANPDINMKQKLTSIIDDRLSHSKDYVTNRHYINSPSDPGLFVFNTNLIHKGNYLGQSSSFRALLEFQVNSKNFLQLLR
jgi:hypothetical protein